MMYLLDVNALVALGVTNHQFHDRVATWVTSSSSLSLATCSITEIGFVRVVAQAPIYGFTIAQARSLLLRLKQTRPTLFGFITDSHDASRLPGWVKAPKQITDGHLSKLAGENGAVLATLDESIPGSFLIPR